MTGKLITRSRCLWIAGIGGFLLFYFLFDPLNYSWMPQCLFHKFTGFQCMGCGSQRVVHALLHGDIKEAWEANRFMLLSLPFMFLLLFSELTRKRNPGLYRRVHSLPVILTVTAMLLAWLFIRNIFGY